MEKETELKKVEELDEWSLKREKAQSLSDKLHEIFMHHFVQAQVQDEIEEDIKEFIKRLKNKQCLIKDGTEHCNTCLTCQEINKLAGDKLTK